MNGIERINRMHEGNAKGVPVNIFYSTEYMCRISGVPDYSFLYDKHEKRARAHIETARRHKPDGMYIWTRGKRKDWRDDYRITETDGEVYIFDAKNGVKRPLSEDHYAILFTEKPPYRRPFIQYGESQEIVNGVPYFSKPKLDINSISDVDKYLPFETKEEIKEGGMFDGIKMIADAIGKEVFLDGVCNSSFRMAIGTIGLQEGLMFMKEEPEVFEYLLRRVTDQELEYLKVMAENGIHSAWITNIWLDLISESDYRKFVMPGDRRFIELAKELGIKSHYFPCGKVPYIIECANELKPDAVHLEEFSRLDIGEIRKRVDSNILLYGNVHAIDVLLNGSVREIEEEVKRQIDICLPQGPFIMSIGSEVALKTPCANVDALIEAAHSYK